MNTDIQARKLTISGVVQGVGFRPFLFQLAAAYGLTGEVWNTPQGVTLVVEGPLDGLDGLCRDIVDKSPPLASVREIRQDGVPVKGFSAFSIARSNSENPSRSTLIPPDVSVCRECLDEMQDPLDRRYRYPFINCTNCGPRYTIIRDLPYDRPGTSMHGFPMCTDCLREYNDPLDRRFHAQPNACPNCGPHVFIVDASGRPVDLGGEDPVDAAAGMLRQGAVVAVKGLGGFHLAVDACNPEAVAMLRSRKRRPHKPFAVMAGSLADIMPHARISRQEQELLESCHRPIVLLEKKPESHGTSPGIAPGVAPGNGSLGVMLPYTPLHYRLFETGPRLLVMTSGNRSGEPLSIDNQDALDAFAHIADAVVLHDRDIYFRADDSIVQVQDPGPLFLRRSRGYAPLPVFLRAAFPGVLACGGGLKSTVCLTKENRAFLSQHIGDLDDRKSFAVFTRSIDHLQTLLDIHPEVLAHDMHPGYMSTAWALEQSGIDRIAVQHHHAHAVSCMAEHGLGGEVMAITLDGTGYGTDGNIWGGEILTCTETDFQRRGHLSYMPMPGGDAAVKEPWRMAVSVLHQAFGDDCASIDIPFIRNRDPETLAFITRMISRKINSPLTSSCGRLFDAVAALLGIRERISFESQAAMELQAMAVRPGESRYDFQVKEQSGTGEQPLLEIDMAPCITGIVEDIRNGRTVQSIAAAFHRTVIDAFVAAAVAVSRETGITDVVLSGGVFNNAIVSNAMAGTLEKSGFSVYTHTLVPAGDGGISLGQAVIAGAITRKDQ